MAQKLKNQKGKKQSKPAKSKTPVKAKPSVKPPASSQKTKNVKKAGKTAKLKSSQLSPVRKPVKPVKVEKSPLKAKKTSISAPKSQKPVKIALKTAPPAKKAVVAPAKTKAPKVVAPVVVTPPVDIRNLPTIKRPGAGQVQQRRVPGKQQKKVFRTELIFPNQLRETPLLKGKNKAEPKGKFELEFLVKSSPTLLFDFLSTPSGLSEWFADDVDIRNEEFTFHWDGQVQRAKLLAYKQDHMIRLRWNDKNEDFYFEFRIDHDDLTGDVTLIVTDFGESEDDLRTSRLLWESQVSKLLKVLGAY
ncbi:MAG TPA: START-like domain-containing protein [Bacteroidia bacterium]|jgi:uncharacterized protein YndB with AHSA1/START domain|nr:START-like domain-containing protein [Bacteroidia bacterium]